MFAVIRTGGKQYKVQEGDVLNVELLDSQDDKSAQFEVLLIGNGDKVTVGNPLVKGASVTADILGEIKDKKVVAFKYKRRQGYHRTVGHRQRKTQVKIKSIVG